MICSIHQSGEFYASKEWYPFTAMLIATCKNPGFVWNAHCQILGMPNSIMESYIGGQGHIITKAWGRLPLLQVEEEEPYVLFWLAMAPLFPFEFQQHQGKYSSYWR